jgi:hypothetical protein
MGGPTKPSKASSTVHGTDLKDDDEHDEYDGQVLGGQARVLGSRRAGL